MKKILVCFFSASGTTRGVAEKFSKAVEGDLFEIKPKRKYTPEDLDWTNKHSRSSIEMSSNAKVEIESLAPISDYDTICLAFPIWWYKEPVIIDSFLEENDLTGKEIYIFVTSGSSCSEGALTSLKERFPNLNFVSSKRFTGAESEDECISWIS